MSARRPGRSRRDRGRAPADRAARCNARGGGRDRRQAARASGPSDRVPRLAPPTGSAHQVAPTGPGKSPPTGRAARTSGPAARPAGTADGESGCPRERPSVRRETRAPRRQPSPDRRRPARRPIRRCDDRRATGEDARRVGLTRLAAGAAADRRARDATARLRNSRAASGYSCQRCCRCHGYAGRRMARDGRA